MHCQRLVCACQGRGRAAGPLPPKPTGIQVTPESLTLRVGETAGLDVKVLPEGAPQEFAANILDKTIATINSKE